MSFSSTHQPAEEPRFEEQNAILEGLAAHALTLHPMVKRRILPVLPEQPPELHLGWAQLPASKGKGFSLGLFTDKRHFSQIALVDGHGRVFMGDNPSADTFDQQPVFRFLPEAESAYTSEEPGSLDDTRGITPDSSTPLHGAIVGQDDMDRPLWLAAWSRRSRRYNLLELRPVLDETLRSDLEYRDAIAIAFFATYLLPRLEGFLVGYGSGNIFRRLRQEAPLGAIRRSVADALRAGAQGLRVSGLEEHFSHVMHEVGALDEVQSLEAVHGAEPMHLFTSSYSKAFFLSWGNLQYRAALKALQIEGNLNRFANVSALLERNRRRGLSPTEDDAPAALVAQMDMNLLENPVLVALPTLRFEHPKRQVAVEPGLEINDYLEYARQEAQHVMDSAKYGGITPVDGIAHSEWRYRQTIASLIRQLRLPYRFDAEFRSNIAGGTVAIGFTTAGMAMMPQSRFDKSHNGWVDLNRNERARLSAMYNLRVGLMLATLAFGADDAIENVTLQIDSIGLEEAVEEQDSAIAQMLTDALAAFERARTGHGLATTGAKGDPKDGDVHGNPLNATVPPSQEPQAAADFDDLDDDIDDDDDETDEGDLPDDVDDETTDLDTAFNDVMQGVDLGDVIPQIPGEPDESADDSDTDGDDNDPMTVLQKNPTVRRMVTVTFTRKDFIGLMGTVGLNDAEATYEAFGASMDMTPHSGLVPVESPFGWRDSAFAPAGAQEEPELSDKQFSAEVASVFGAGDALGLSIQREDLLQHAVGYFNELEHSTEQSAVESAQKAMALVARINDPELSRKAELATGALIDGQPMPDIRFDLAKTLDTERLRARGELFKGQTQEAITIAEQAVERYDAQFAAGHGIPRYFNSYAERVVYNKLFAVPGEKTVLIPDNLFYAHLELADLLAQVSGPQASIKHLNTMVSYAPAYPLSHLRQSVQLARIEDWDSARAATLNALRVALDRDDAAFAYYRYAYSEWMRDNFDLAVAGYVMSDSIHPGGIPALQGELSELMARVQSQCIEVPRTAQEAAELLEEEGVPVWPSTEVTKIIQRAARVAVDEGLFVPARTLALASARMDDSSEMGLDMVQAQFLRSLNA